MFLQRGHAPYGEAGGVRVVTPAPRFDLPGVPQFPQLCTTGR